MILYLSIIFIAMTIIALLNILVGNSGQSILYISLLVVILTTLQIVIDIVFATLARWCVPKKLVGVDKKIFCASKKEQRFYERIGIKKWKDKVLELGKVTGFAKNKLGDTNDIKYVERFIVEANYGILVHLFCIVFGFAIVFICPAPFRWSVGLPVWCVNVLLNSMSTFILRYNLPKLHTLYKFNKRRHNLEQKPQSNL